MKTLDTLTLEDQSVTIETITGDPETVVRFYALGFIPGAPVALYNTTAFNGPKIFSVQGSQIALRETDAQHIYVSFN
jgi:Fe2+ transport system protein FeoA